MLQSLSYTVGRGRQGIILHVPLPCCGRMRQHLQPTEFAQVVQLIQTAAQKVRYIFQHRIKKVEEIQRDKAVTLRKVEQASSRITICADGGTPSQVSD